MPSSQRGVDPVDRPEEYEVAWGPTLEQLQSQVKAEHEDVTELGGLYAGNRAPRVAPTNQLRGRSGRQGDPGESRFYLSLQDDLMRLFKSEWVDMILRSLNIPDDQPIEHSKSATRSRARRPSARRRTSRSARTCSSTTTCSTASARSSTTSDGWCSRVRTSPSRSGMLDDSVAAYVQGGDVGGLP